MYKIFMCNKDYLHGLLPGGLLVLVECSTLLHLLRCIWNLDTLLHMNCWWRFGHHR